MPPPATEPDLSAVKYFEELTVLVANTIESFDQPLRMLDAETNNPENSESGRSWMRKKHGKYVALKQTLQCTSDEMHASAFLDMADRAERRRLIMSWRDEFVRAVEEAKAPN